MTTESFAFCKVSLAVVLILLGLMELFGLEESAVVEADIVPIFGESSGSMAVDWTTVSDMSEAARSVTESKEEFRELDD